MNKEYINNQFDRLLSVQCSHIPMSVQVKDNESNQTNWMNVTQDQVKQIHEVLSGMRVLGHDPDTQVACIWGIEDIRTLRIGISNEDAMEVLTAANAWDANNKGITWDVLREELHNLDEYKKGMKEIDNDNAAEKKWKLGGPWE